MTISKLMASAAVVALLSGPALAQDTTSEQPADAGTGTSYTDPVEPAPLYTSIDEMTVGEFIGMVVYDPDGERIGEIDYVVPHDNGHAGVIGIGGFLGLGEYTVAIPLEDFELAAEGASLTLDTDKETLEQTPEFDESDAQSLPDDTPIATLVDRADDGTMQDDASDAMTEGAEVGDMDTGGAMDGEVDTGADASDDMEADETVGSDTDTDGTADTEMDAGSDTMDGMETEGTETTGSDTEVEAEGDAAAECPEGSTDPACAPVEAEEDAAGDAN